MFDNRKASEGWKSDQPLATPYQAEIQAECEEKERCYRWQKGQNQGQHESFAHAFEKGKSLN